MSVSGTIVSVSGNSVFTTDNIISVRHHCVSTLDYMNILHIKVNVEPKGTCIVTILYKIHVCIIIYLSNFSLRDDL